MLTCKIQWVDPSTGDPTPDACEAVGYAVHTDAATGERKEFPICAAHLGRMKIGPIFWRGERIGSWDFENFPDLDVRAMRRESGSK